MSDRTNAFEREIPSAPERKKISAEERQLARDLAQLLGHPPRRGGNRAPNWTQFDDEDVVSEEDDGAKTKAQSPLTPPPLPAAASVDNDTSHGQPESPQTRERTPDSKNVWHPKRNYTWAKQAGSWLVSLLIGGFIIAVVSVILLGVPKNLDPRSWLSANASSAPMQVSAPAPRPAASPGSIQN